MYWEQARMIVPGELIGKVFTKIEVTKSCNDKDDMIVFICSDETRYEMFHEQECCELVNIEDIVGNIEDLLHSPIIMAEEETECCDNSKDDEDDSWTWTFYKFATVKGYVTIRWYGSSNGYYGEEAAIYEIKSKEV